MLLMVLVHSHECADAALRMQCGAHYTHAISVIFLSQASHVAKHRHPVAIGCPGTLPAAKWERDHGVHGTMCLPVHSGRNDGLTPVKRCAKKTAIGKRVT